MHIFYENKSKSYVRNKDNHKRRKMVDVGPKLVSTGSKVGRCTTEGSRQKHAHVFLIVPETAAAAKLLQSCLTLSNPMELQPTRLLHPWDFPGKSTGVGCHCLLLLSSIASFSSWSLSGQPIRLQPGSSESSG